MTENPSRQPTVFVAIPTAGKDGQQRLEGVLRYLRLGHTSWNLKLVISRGVIPVDEIERLADGGTDAFLLHLPYDRAETDRLSRIGRPIVVTTSSQSPVRDRRGLRFVLLDNRELGHAAAAHLMSLGRFASYGFVPSTYATNWSDERGAAFAEKLAENGFRCSMFTGIADSYTRTHDHRALGAWLRSLAKPAAVFAANDNYALQTLLACSDSGLEIPGQVALLGIDNDELITGGFHPSLSSLEPDFSANGFNAALELDRMIRQRGAGRKVPAVSRQRAAKPRLVIRESTAFLSPASKLVENALACIGRLALSGATPGVIAANLGVSRCLLDLRLREARQPTVSTLLRNRRLEEVRKLLKTTNLPIDIIAKRCAFPNANHLRNLFRRTFGIAMRDYRRHV